MAHAKQSQRDLQATQGMSAAGNATTVDSLARLFPELEIEGLIGHGGMGAVYRVRQRNLDRLVALKVFLHETDDPEFTARFQREARALAKLNHPNIVTVHDFGQREGLHFLLMEYVDGLNLRQLTQSERLAPQEALEMVPQLCDALQYAHDSGVIHRDIKPENLLLDVNGRIKIADFGLAKMTGKAHEGTLTRTQQIMGTLNYMAPEQREKPTEVDHRADIYSLGVVIYEMLTGELPLGRFQPPSVKSSVDQSLDEVVMRALEKEPERRYQHANEFKTGVQTASSVEMIAAAVAAAPGSPEGNPVHSASFHENQGFQPSPPRKRMEENPFESSWRLSMALFSGCEKAGAWIPGKPHISFTMFGGSDLNLTEVDADEVTIYAWTMFGGTEIIVPRGARVDIDGLMMFGALENKIVRYEGFGASDMKVRIRAYGGFGGASIRTPTELEVPLPSEAVKPVKMPMPEVAGWKTLVCTLYQFVAMLAMFGMIILFASSTEGYFFPENQSKYYAILSLFTAIGMWCNSNNFRRLIGAGPAGPDAKSQNDYYKLTYFGTLLNFLGFTTLFLGIGLMSATGLSNETLPRSVCLSIILCSVPLFIASGQMVRNPTRGSSFESDQF